MEHGLGEDALNHIEAMGEALEEALAFGVTLNPSVLDPDDPGAPDLDIAVDLGELFLDPLDDLRRYPPEHTWPTDESMHVVRPLAFPYPTFDGITPGMSNPLWEETADWLFGVLDR